MPSLFTLSPKINRPYDRNGFGEILDKSSPDRGRLQFSNFDLAGNPQHMEDGRSIQSTYLYDGLGRPTLRNYGTEAIALTYDTGCINSLHQIGRLCHFSDESGATTYGYDVRGNLTRKDVSVDGVLFTTAYEYTAANALRQITYPSGRVVEFVRDQDTGRTREIYTRRSAGSPVDDIVEAFPQSPTHAGVEYAPFGPVESIRFGNGLTSDYVVDQNYRVTDIIHGLIDHDRRHYDARGNVVAIEEFDPHTGHSLGDYGPQYLPHRSELRRVDLITSDYFPDEHNYQLDANGNRTAMKFSDSEESRITSYCYSPLGDPPPLVGCNPPGADPDNRLRGLNNPS